MALQHKHDDDYKSPPPPPARTKCNHIPCSTRVSKHAGGPGSNAARDETMLSSPDQLCSPPSLLLDGYWRFPGSKAVGASC
jgi:hypothetical protein